MSSVEKADDEFSLYGWICMDEPTRPGCEVKQHRAAAAD